MFEGIVGNENVKNELMKSITLNKLSHSYLFIGTEGIGKKLIAKEFSKNILSIDEEKKVNLENNPDFEIIEAEGLSMKIEQIRQMQKKILEAPIMSSKKIYILNDADLMTVEAQNCLLKTLEEPPEFVIIILIGSMDSNFLSTIKSRCTIIKFQNISDEDIKKYLNFKYNINNISDTMIQIFGGSIGKAEKYVDKQELYNSISEISEKINQLDLIDFIKKSSSIYDHQEDKFEILENLNVAFFNKLKNDVKYANCIDIIEDTKRRLNANGNFNMCIDNMLFRLWEELH